MNSPHKKIVQCGFTLVEIMVALAVLALSGIALMTTISQATSDISRLNDKVVALGVAEYAINNVLIRDEFPKKGKEEEIITLADREWLVEVEISDTPNEDVRRIDVLVSPYGLLSDKAAKATILLSAFRANIY